MKPDYSISVTSKDSATFREIDLTDPDHIGDSLTRKIVRGELVNNVHDASASVKATILHKRRRSKRAPWEDAESFSLAQLPAGQYVRMILDAGETLRLYEALTDLYGLTTQGVPVRHKHLLVVDADGHGIVSEEHRALLAALIEQAGDDFAAIIEELRPNLLETAYLAREHARKRAAVEEFEQHLFLADWTEPEWDRFFREHAWIFGHNLVYQFLDPIQPQAAYGGVDLGGSGGQRGDYLMGTRAAARYTVLVEIKRPDTPLLEEKPYRNRAYAPSRELAGAVAQMQRNCLTWATDGSRQIENQDILGDTLTCEPRGVLVIGNTDVLRNRDRRYSFELLERARLGLLRQEGE